MVVNHVAKLVCPAPIGWLGGKSQLAPTIIGSMPPHKCYVEVCGGSCVVFFGKPIKLSKIEIINDINEELVNLMKVISGTCFDETVRQEFIGYVRSMPAARAVYEDWKHWKTDRLENLNPAQRAFRFYYCVKKGFSSHPRGGYEASPLTSSRYNMSSEFDYIAARFRESNAQIERLDFRILVEKYNRKEASTFFFIDPPYFVANNTNYYEFVFSEQDHLDLKKCCDDIRDNDNTFLITYDDVPEVLDLYKGYSIYRTDPIVYSASDERGERNLSKRELFITNYDIADVVRKRQTGQSGDMFDIADINDRRVDFPNHIGLEKVN